ncbi:MAG: DMT family transporter [Bdellovibrionales bacterium]|nr:DMT family transporter [Bdellovibrionales bacterium]
MGLRSGHIYMIVAVVFFAVMNTAVKFLSHIPFYQVVFLRALISGILCSLMMIKGKVSFKGHDKRMLFYRGLFGTMAMSLYIKSLQDLPLASAVSILQMSPLFMLFVSGALLKEKATSFQWVFFMLAFIGVLFIKGFDTDVEGGSIVVALTAAFLAGVSHTLIRKLKGSDHELVIIFYFSLISVVLMAYPALSTWVNMSLQDWGWAFIVGATTQIAQVFLTKAYHREKIANVSLLNYLGIIFSVIIGISVFAETYTWINYMGMAVVFFGIYGNTLTSKKILSK